MSKLLSEMSTHIEYGCPISIINECMDQFLHGVEDSPDFLNSRAFILQLKSGMFIKVAISNNWKTYRFKGIIRNEVYIFINESEELEFQQWLRLVCA